MINMIVILDKNIDEDDIQDILDIVLNRFKDSANLVSSCKYNITKKSLKKKYKEFIKSTPKDFLTKYGINSFDDYISEYWNIIGFIGDEPIVLSNPDALFDEFDIDDVFRKYEVDEFDIIDDMDYLLDKEGTLYEVGDNPTTVKIINILHQCDYNDFIVIVSSQD